MSFLLCLAAVATGSAASGDNAPARTVVLAADKWCPVNCDAAGEPSGYAIDMAREAFAAAGWKLDYRVMPWERAIEAVRAGRIDGVVGILRKNAPEFVYPAETIGNNVNAFFVRGDSTWRYRGLHSIEQMVIGIANDYLFGEPFDGYVVRYRNDPKRLAIIYSPDPVQQGLDLLAAGRIDAYLDDPMVVKWALRGNTAESSVRDAGTLSNVPLYIAFSPVRADARATADAFDRGVRQMRADGRLEAIMARYGLNDWGGPNLKP